MNPEIKEKFPEWAARYEEMQDLLFGLYYARNFQMDHNAVVDSLNEVDYFLRREENNYN
jgi:hypothetical protein